MQGDNPEGKIVVAAVQMASAFGDLEENRHNTLVWLKRAADAGASLVVLPELCITGYAPHTRAEAHALGESIPGPTVDAWAEVARRAGLIVVGGLCERAGDACYNTAAVVGADGLLAAYRKAHLFEREKMVFHFGTSGFPMVALPIGGLGVLICYDLRFPEAVRTLALHGVDIIAVPTAWVTLRGRLRDERGMCIQAYCALAHASMNRLFLVCAGMVGRFQETELLGNSLIADVSGWPLAGPAVASTEELLLAEIEPSQARSKRISCHDDLFDDRRPDLYDLPGAPSEPVEAPRSHQ